MSGWLRVLAAALVVIAVVLVVRQVGFLGLRPFGSARERPPGPAIAGARGKLAFVRNGDLFALDLRDGVERQLTRSGGVRAPRWSRGGTWLAFERDGRVSVMRADGSDPVDVPGSDRPSSVVWSPQAVRLAYAAADGGLSTFDPLARTEPRRKTLVPAGSGVGPTVVWSSDGGRVAYERHQRAAPGINNEGIWTVNELGRDALPVFLASGDFTLNVCCWSHSSAYVLFWQGPGETPILGDPLQLLIARAISSQPVQIAEAVLPVRGWIDSAIRSDGFAVIAGGGRLATEGKRLIVAEPRTVAGGRLAIDTAVIESALAPSSPSWSPVTSGPQMLAYSAGPTLESRGGDLAASLVGRRIWLTRSDGTERRQLLPDATVPANVSDERPIWARDGKSLVFVRRLNAETAARQGAGPSSLELWVASADGAASRRVVGGLVDPGAGLNGVVDWTAVFDYYRG